MKKRWVLKEETIRYLEKFKLTSFNMIRGLEARFNECNQERVNLLVEPFGNFSHLELNLWRDECCEQVEVEYPKPEEIQIVPVQLSIWKQILRFLGL